MQRVFGLPAGEFPYEKHVPPSVELELLKVQDPEQYSTYWEVLCHFFICERLKGHSRGGGAHSTWAEYLFSGVSGDKVKAPSVLSEPQARRLASQSRVTLEESAAGPSSSAHPQNFCYFGRRSMTSQT